MITKWSQYSTSTTKKPPPRGALSSSKLKKTVIDTETAIRRCSTK